MKRNNIVLWVILIAALFIINFNCCITAVLAVNDNPLAVQEKAPDAALKVNVEYSSDKLRDPFSKNENQANQQVLASDSGQPLIRALPALSISAIFWGSSMPQAIINNKIVKIGDTIEEAQIIGIEKNGVSVLFDNQRYNLAVPDMTDTKKYKTEGATNE